MSNKPYVLANYMIFPISGKYDFSNDSAFDQPGNLTVYDLANDIFASSNENSIAPRSILDIKNLLDRLDPYIENERQNKYGLTHQIKRSLSFDFYFYLDNPNTSNQDRINCLRLLKLLFPMEKPVYFDSPFEKGICNQLGNPHCDYLAPERNLSRLYEIMKHLVENGFDLTPENRSLFISTTADKDKSMKVQNSDRHQLTATLLHDTFQTIWSYMTSGNILDYQKRYTHLKSILTDLLQDLNSLPDEPEPNPFWGFYLAITGRYAQCSLHSIIQKMSEISRIVHTYTSNSYAQNFHLDMISSFSDELISDVSSNTIQHFFEQNNRAHSMILGYDSSKLDSSDKKHLAYTLNHTYDVFQELHSASYGKALFPYTEQNIITVARLLFLTKKHGISTISNYPGDNHPKRALKKILLGSYNLSGDSRNFSLQFTSMFLPTAMKIALFGHPNYYLSIYYLLHFTIQLYDKINRFASEKAYWEGCTIIKQKLNALS